MSDPLPPLSIEDAADIVSRLRAVVGGPGVVMIGGSALAFWHNHYTDSPPLDVATTDLDFQGGADDARKAGRLLGGQVNVPKFDDPTPNTGVVTFTDRQGTRRLVDFLQQPYGLKAEQVAARAIPFDVDTGDGNTTRVLLMHPMDCLLSRVANIGLSRGLTDHARAQLLAAIALVPAFSRELLDQGAAPREVLNLNEEIYRLATTDHWALTLYLHENIDVAGAALEDDRLPDAYRSRRLPQLQTQLHDRRERLDPPRPCCARSLQRR